jgi:hypothetical protein
MHFNFDSADPTTDTGHSAFCSHRALLTEYLLELECGKTEDAENKPQILCSVQYIVLQFFR